MYCTTQLCLGSARLSNPFNMQTQAVCPSAKQHGPTGVQNSWHCSLALSPHRHTSRALLGLALTWPQAGHSTGNKHPHVPVLHRAWLCSSPNPSAARSKAQAQGNIDSRAHSLLLSAEMLRKMRPEEAVNCFTKVQQTKCIYVKKCCPVVRGSLTKPLGRNKCILPHFLIRLVIFVTRH